MPNKRGLHDGRICKSSGHLKDLLSVSQALTGKQVHVVDLQVEAIRWLANSELTVGAASMPRQASRRDLADKV